MAPSDHAPAQSAVGLFRGSGGLLWATDACARRAPAFAPTHRQLVEGWMAGARRVLDRLDAHDPQVPIPASLLDVTDGLAGVVRTLVLLATSPIDSGPDPRPLIARASAILCQLSDSIELVKKDPKALGAAHGLPGIAAALAVAIQHDEAAAGARDVLANLVRAVDESRAHVPPLRPSWCSGEDGTAANLGLARSVLDGYGLADVALPGEATAGQAPLSGPGLCHGAAGILLIRDRLGTRVPASVAESVDAALERGARGALTVDRGGTDVWSLLDLLDGAAGFTLCGLELAGARTGLSIFLGLPDVGAAVPKASTEARA
ncbi:hypothetical protein BKA22_001392 [Cellulomonas soli]|nr:hypothetical protein [Cellulomonas soli]